MKPFVSVYLSSFAALLLGALPAFADCVSGNCQDGIGKMTYTDGGEYEGSFKQGYRDGQGTYTWGNKTKYTGNWERGDQNGQGSLYDAEGKVTFAGTWNRGQQVAVALNAAGTPVQSGCVSGNCQEGFGTYVYTTGEKYEGAFKNGSRTGIGTFTWESGVRYVGSWLNGNQNGQGTQYNADGSVSFAGDWQNGKQVTAANANIVQGAEAKTEVATNACLSGDCQNGIGKYLYAGVGTYEGSFKNGVRDGQGTLTWNEGHKYVGSWVADQLNGHGVMSYADGRKFEGSFKDGVRMVGVFSWSDGSRYTGSFKDNRLGGLGVMQNPDGSWYVGAFDNDQKNGQGTAYKTDGSVDFAGTWKNNEKAS